MVEFGAGPPLVLIPGIQGRWEYMRPAIDALAMRFRILTFPLSGEPGSSATFDPGLGYDTEARLVQAALDRNGFERAIVCGVSFGGLPAIRFAATHPARTVALILASSPAPPWRLRQRHRVYARVPWLFGPLFLAETPFRLRKEMVSAVPRRRARWQLARRQITTLGRAPLSPTRMAARAALMENTDIVGDCAKVEAPTLIITGEQALDRVVPVDRTRAYLDLIPGARHVTLESTGHLGSITRPRLFADLISQFVEAPVGIEKGSERQRRERFASEDSSDAA
jgi:3-oxoadipate enol-lactonase